MGSQIPNPDIYGVGPAARFIGVSEDTLREYADKKRIPCKRDAVGNRIFKFSDLVNFINQRRKANDSAARKRRKLLDKLQRRLERGEITAKEEREAARRIKDRKS